MAGWECQGFVFICFLFHCHQERRGEAAKWKKVLDNAALTHKAVLGHLEDGGTL